MKFYLIFAFFQLLGVSLSKKEPENLPKLSTQLNCQHELIPGLDRMGKGIDLNTLDFFPKGFDAIKQANGYMESIFSFGCSKGLSWTNRNDKTNRVFSQPDEVESVSYLPMGEAQVSVSISSSLKERKHSLGVQAGVGAAFKGICFSASGGYQNAKSTMLQTKKVIATVNFLNVNLNTFTVCFNFLLYYFNRHTLKSRLMKLN